MAERKRKSKRDYLNNFHVDLNGQYAYAGKVVSFDGSTQEYTAKTRYMAAASAALMAVVIAGGCLSGAGITNCFYVILPYIVEVGGAGGLLYAAVKLVRANQPIREYVFKASFEKIHGRSRVTMAAAACGLAGNILFVALNGFEGRVLSTVFYMGLKIISAVLAASVTGTATTMKFKQ